MYVPYLAPLAPSWSLTVPTWNTPPSYLKWGKAGGAKRPKRIFTFQAKKPLHTGVRRGCHNLISLTVFLSICLSVCLCACVCVYDCVYMCHFRWFYMFRNLYETDLHKPGIYGSRRAWSDAWDVLRRTTSRPDRVHRPDVDFIVCFGCGWVPCFFFSFLSSNVHGLLQVWGRLAPFTPSIVILLPW